MTTTPLRLAAARPLVVTDLLRAVALVSVVLGALGWGFVGFALFLLVLGGTMVPRALGAPLALDAAYCSGLLLGAWAAELDWYLRIGWLDVVVHATVTGLVAAMGYVAMVRVGMLPQGVHRSGAAVVTAALGTTLAVVWELGEWFGHTFVDERIQVGYADTVGDLAAGAAGATVAGVALGAGVLMAGTRR
ncbi:hypothetical protein [Nocardioides pantholopis]|uniref:hypothetical protein n=1 Tax=Nocardioides pantholopis TaxID=2483798 RepID=UPI0019D0E8DD|nr:hypothetical protein [Nocardioides pantholopis]